MSRRSTSGTRFIFGIDTKPMKFKGFKPSGNPFRGAILMQEGGTLPNYQNAGVITKDTKLSDISPELMGILKAAQKATPIPLPKPTPSTGTSKQVKIGPTTQDKNLAYRNQMLEQQRLQAIENERILAEEKAALAAREQNKPFTFPDGSTKTWDQMDVRERGYVTGKGLRNKGRWNQDDPTPTSWYNPVAMLYDMSASLGEAPYQAKQSNSVIPYVSSIGTTLAAGALGSLGTKTAGQFVNNVFNPIPLGSKQEFLDIIQTLKNNRIKNVELSKAEEELLNSTRVIGSLVNSGNVDESLSILQSLKNKSNNISDDAFEKLTGFKKTDIDNKIKSLQEGNSKKQDILTTEYQTGSYRPDYGTINLQRPSRTGIPINELISRADEDLSNIQHLISNQMPDLPNEIYIDITGRGRTLIPGQEYFFRPPKPESIFSRIRKRIDNSEKPSDMPVLQSLIPSLSKNQNNNPAREILQAYNTVKNANKGTSFIPAHSLSSDSYNRLSLPLIEKGLKDNIINLNYHGLQPLNNLGFPTKAGIKPEIILNEINSKISNINKLTGKKYPFAELQGQDIFYPQFSVTRKQLGGNIKVDPMGYWNKDNHGKPVIIPSGDITMQGVDIPLLGISNIGERRIMMPNSRHKFKGTSVLEIPLTNPYKMQQGGFSLEQVYKFLFDDEEETNAPVTAPSESELEELKQEQFLAGQKEASKKYAKELRKMKNNQAVMQLINDNPELNFDNFISGKSFIAPSSNIPFPVNPIYSKSNSSKKYIPTVSKAQATEIAYQKGAMAVKYLQEKYGLPKHIAAGIAGNAMQESSFRDDVIGGSLKGDKGQSFGLFQWYKDPKNSKNDRVTPFFNWAKQNNRNPYDMYTQLDFGIHEAKQRGDLQAIMKAQNATQAANIWRDRFEIPAVRDSDRAQYANTLMSFQIGGTYDVDPITLLELKRKGYKYKIV